MAARRSSVGIAVLAAVASLAAIVPAPATGHDPDLGPAEAVGNPAGLAGIPFRGPVGTSIELTVCPPIPDPDRPLYADPGTGHIGHINGVTGPGTAISNYIEPGSVDLWHLESDAYNIPTAIEGPHATDNTVYSVMMGSDGFFRGKMHSTVFDGVGPELKITDVHTRRTYCIYGAIEHGGPYFFMLSTYTDPTPTTTTNVDMSLWYNALFSAYYPTEPVRADYVFLVTSTFIDEPVPPPAAPTASIGLVFLGTTCEDSHVELSAAGSLDTDGTIVSFAWDLGDGTTSTDLDVTHTYASAGPHTVTLTVTDDDGLTDTVSMLVNDIGDPQCCPVVANLQWWYVYEGDEVAFSSSAYDYEDDALTWTASGLPNGATFTPDGDFFWQTRTGDAGRYLLTVVASDGVCEGTEDFRITVLRPGEYPPAPDIDRDGIEDDADNCPVHPNHEQEDRDRDGLGDICDEAPDAPDADALVTRREFFLQDADLDGIADGRDNCIGTANADQADLDDDAVGDMCDPDVDGDGVRDSAGKGAFLDNCPAVGNADQKDGDLDGIGDACDGRLDAAVPGRSAPDAASAAQPVLSASSPIAWIVAAALVAAVLAMLLVAVVMRRR